MPLSGGCPEDVALETGGVGRGRGAAFAFGAEAPPSLSSNIVYSAIENVGLDKMLPMLPMPGADMVVQRRAIQPEGWVKPPKIFLATTWILKRTTH